MLVRRPHAPWTYQGLSHKRNGCAARFGDITMKKLVLTSALLIAGLFAIATPSTAHAQSVGISVGGRHGGFSVHFGGGYYGGGYAHVHHPGCGHWYPGYSYPRPVYPAPVYHASITVYETVNRQVWDGYCWHNRQFVVE